ncbi:MAG: hypothetical protein D6796_11540, partial [Caldilineae bacterium]
QGGVALFPHSAAALKAHLPPESVSLVVSSLPLPNPVLWKLSVLWTGWLLGLRAAEDRHLLLWQKWPDWNWYRRTLLAVMHALHPTLLPDAVWVLHFAESDTLQAPALTLAALHAGFDIESWRIDGLRHHLILTPVPLNLPPPEDPASLAQAVRAESRDAVQGFLQTHGAPVAARRLFLAAWESLLYSGLLARVLVSLPPEETLRWTAEQIESVM